MNSLSRGSLQAAAEVQVAEVEVVRRLLLVAEAAAAAVEHPYHPAVVAAGLVAARLDSLLLAEEAAWEEPMEGAQVHLSVEVEAVEAVREGRSLSVVVLGQAVKPLGVVVAEERPPMAPWVAALAQAVVTPGRAVAEGERRARAAAAAAPGL